MEKKILFTGIRPTGNLHLGHYFSIIKPLMEYSATNDYQIYIMIADLHALTELKTKNFHNVYDDIRMNTVSIVRTLSRFIPIEKTVIFCQSDLKQYHYDLFYKLLMISKHAFTFGNPVFTDVIRSEYHRDIDLLKLNEDTRDLLKEFLDAHPETYWGHITENLIPGLMHDLGMTYLQVLKIVKQLNERIGVMGLASYPILMASDILLYKPDYVLVGKDQSPHLQITNDIIKLLNKLYHFKMSKIKPMIVSEESIQGNDGRKMSKSYNNHLPLEYIFNKDKYLADKWINSIKTFSRRLGDPGQPAQCTMGNYYKIFQNNELTDLCENGAVGCVGCKVYFYSMLQGYMNEVAQHKRLTENFVHHHLDNGAKKAYNRLLTGNDLSGFLFGTSLIS